MRKRLRWAFGALSVAAAAASGTPAGAGEMSLTIPFDFVVNEAALTAGRYRVSTQGSVLLLRGWNDGAASVTIRGEGHGEGAPGLVFHKYGDRYLLAEAWLGSDSGRIVPTSRLERELVASAKRARLVKAFGRITVPMR